MFYSCLFPIFFSSSSFLEFLTLRISLCLSQSSPFCPFSPPPPLWLVEFNVLGIIPLSCCFVVTEEFIQSRGRRKNWRLTPGGANPAVWGPHLPSFILPLQLLSEHCTCSDLSARWRGSSSLALFFQLTLASG